MVEGELGEMDAGDLRRDSVRWGGRSGVGEKQCRKEGRTDREQRVLERWAGQARSEKQKRLKTSREKQLENTFQRVRRKEARRADVGNPPIEVPRRSCGETGATTRWRGRAHWG